MRNQNDIDDELARDIWDRICSTNELHIRVTSKILKIILMKHWTNAIYWKGVKLTFKKKSLGCGVYDIWMDEEK
jgi:hypothetical protein